MAKASDAMNGHRQLAFWFISALILMIVIVSDLTNQYDSCLVIYFFEASFSLICALMFANWWRVKGSATSIYKWLTTLLFAIVINNSVQFAARWIYIYSPDNYTQFINSVWWGYRGTLQLVALIYLFTFAVWQRYGRQTTYYNGIRKDMAEGFERLEGRIVEGDMRFLDHTHKGVVVGVTLVLETPSEKEK